MNLTLIGFILSFIGAFAFAFETISGGYIRPKIYYLVLKGVCEIDINHCIRKIKLNNKEKRVLIWIILMFLGFLLSIISYIDFSQIITLLKTLIKTN